MFSIFFSNFFNRLAISSKKNSQSQLQAWDFGRLVVVVVVVVVCKVGLLVVVVDSEVGEVKGKKVKEVGTLVVDEEKVEEAGTVVVDEKDISTSLGTLVDESSIDSK